MVQMDSYMDTFYVALQYEHQKLWKNHSIPFLCTAYGKRLASSYAVMASQWYTSTNPNNRQNNFQVSPPFNNTSNGLIANETSRKIWETLHLLSESAIPLYHNTIKKLHTTF